MLCDHRELSGSMMSTLWLGKGEWSGSVDKKKIALPFLLHFLVSVPIQGVRGIHCHTVLEKKKLFSPAGKIFQIPKCRHPIFMCLKFLPAFSFMCDCIVGCGIV